MKSCTCIAHEKPTSNKKQNSEISTDVIGNDVIVTKFERFHWKALNFIRFYHSSLQMKRGKN